MLTFYEHYTPVKNKNLGGAINYSTSDAEVIDGIGYNAAFWDQNPIVKRTPLEEALIKDFELNQAFGTVFMNNEEEVVLRPDTKNSAMTKEIVATYESHHKDTTRQKILLALDKMQYEPGEYIQFAAYVLDRLTLKPLLFGSRLKVQLVDHQGTAIYSQQYDINRGLTYGSMSLPTSLLSGEYQVRAFTNISDKVAFETSIGIDYQPRKNMPDFIDQRMQSTDSLVFEYYPESGLLLQGMPNQVVVMVKTPAGSPVQGNWLLADSFGTILRQVSTDRLGIGKFELLPAPDTSYYFTDMHFSDKWAINGVEKTGLLLHIGDDRINSLYVEVLQHPALTRKIYLLSSSYGKVYRAEEILLSGRQNSFDIPLQHLRPGVNALVATDQSGNVLAKRSFFVKPEELSISLISAEYKSRGSKRIALQFLVTNPEGKVVKAKLNLTVSTINRQNTSPDIRKKIFLKAQPSTKQWISIWKTIPLPH